jgi:hypothetical protein
MGTEHVLQALMRPLLLSSDAAMYEGAFTRSSCKLHCTAPAGSAGCKLSTNSCLLCAAVFLMVASTASAMWLAVAYKGEEPTNIWHKR